MRVFDGTGRPIALGREIARGGEGAVLEVTHDASLVAKIYHTSVENEKANKLRTMARAATPDLLRVAAWPTATLHESPGGEMVGLLMPMVTGHHEVHELYSPAQRKLNFPKADWSFLAHVAMNCAAAFETVHGCGHVIGDVNQSGVLVSIKGTVHLIDCDSFQIRSNGRVFYCAVGVPQFTPPELQGKAFNSIERTEAHDCFGLAILIFHLLFMGRHPFAGRYHGSGDMPIERAISEGRFAFGRSAASFQMTPPPYSLPFDALPTKLAAMFERAFARPQHALTRPRAAEWRDAMVSLKAELQACRNDPGHRYSPAMSSCPWCEIMRHGGPNFFISVSVVVSGLRYELPPLDVHGLWRRIDAIRPPWVDRPVIPPPPVLKPKPLPEELADQRTMLIYAKVVTVAAVIVTIIGAIMSVLALLVGLALTAIFGVAWIVLMTRSKLKRELAARRTIARSKRNSLQVEQRKWDDTAETASRRFEALRGELAEVKSQAERVPSGFQQERQQIEANRRQEQLEEFLETKFIRAYQISKIGPGRQATLLSYGIETAADVVQSRLEDVPGFGPAIISELIAWREEVARAFRFDPSKRTPGAQMQALIIKYRQLQQTCEARLVNGAAELERITGSTEATLKTIGANILMLVAEVRQADADLKLVGRAKVN